MSEPDYAIAWTAPARRALSRLPEKVATAVVEFLYGSLAASPHRVGKPLKLGLEGLHSARRGDYRVIYLKGFGVRALGKGDERVTPAGGQPFLHVIDAPRKECIIRGEAIDGTSIRAHNVGFVPEICIQHAAHLVLGNVPADQRPYDDNILYLFSRLPEKGHQDMGVITGDDFDKRSSLRCDLLPKSDKRSGVAIEQLFL